MELSIFKRESVKKGDTNKIRLKQGIPAVLYAEGMTNENIYINTDDFNKALKLLPKGRLSTAKFVLVDGDKKYSAIIKDIQYHPTTYRVIHLDFLALDEKKPLKLRVPIELTSIDNCKGVKEGGVLRLVIRKLKVKCLPKDIPTHFELDTKDIAIGEDKRLKDIVIPSTIKPLGQMEEVAVVVAKR